MKILSKIQRINNTDAIGLLLEDAAECFITKADTGETILQLRLGHWNEAQLYSVYPLIWEKVLRHYPKQVEKWSAE